MSEGSSAKWVAFSLLSSRPCFRAVRAPACQNPRQDSCELLDWLRRNENHSSIPNSASRDCPTFQGCHFSSLVKAMLTAANAVPWRLNCVCPVKHQLQMLLKSVSLQKAKAQDYLYKLDALLKPILQRVYETYEYHIYKNII